MELTGTDAACARCGQTVRAEFRYCPWCGAKRLNTMPAGQSPVGFAIQFPVSNHPALSAVLTAAQKRGALEEIVSSGELVYRVSFGETELLGLAQLAALADRLPAKAVLRAGREMVWEDAFGFLPCYLQRQMHENPENHCFGEETRGTFNLWGCIRVGLPFSVEGEWCRWGQFEGETTRFRFDTQRFRQEIEHRLGSVKLCPALTTDFARSVLDVFPEAVDPHRERDWTFVQARSGEEGMSVVVRTGFGGRERITVLGVGPRGRGASREILAKVSAARGRKRPSLLA